MNYHGKAGLKKNYDKAFYWYTLAAEAENADAQNNLGYMYYKGYGVEQNNKQAIYWFQKAAIQGHSIALEHLLLMYKSKK